MSQKDMIRDHLNEGNSITPLEALTLYGCFRLSARIKNLRDEGWDIVTDNVTRNGKRFASYRMVT